MSDRNHCGKCIHLRRAKPPKRTGEGGFIQYWFFAGFYYCAKGAMFWADRKLAKESICEHFRKTKQ